MQETQWSVRALLNHQPTEPMTFELKALNIGDRLNGNLILVRYAQSLTCASTCVRSICSINLWSSTSTMRNHHAGFIWCPASIIFVKIRS